MRRLTILLAALAALALLPVAQASANGTATVQIAGNGKGKVSSADGLGAWPEFSFLAGYGIWQGTPAIECSYASPGPVSGTCVNTMEEQPELEPGVEVTALRATAAAGSVFAGWRAVKHPFSATGSSQHYLESCVAEQKETAENSAEQLRDCALNSPTGLGNSGATAIFCLESEPNCSPPVRYLAKATVSPSGAGTLFSEPGGLSCSTSCSHEFLDGEQVKMLPPSAASGYKFTGWSGCDSVSGKACLFTVSSARSVTANFVALLPLTVTKAGEGSGTVTSSPAGINCSPTCKATFEEGAEVTLTAAAAEGSEFTGWSGSGCSGTGTCKVTMSEAKEVTATFDLKPAGPTNLRTLTVTKSANGPGGTGTVSSKPKGIKCATTCPEAVARMYKDTPVELVAKPTLTSAFVEWQNAKEGGTCDGSTSASCTVPMSEDVSLEAVFSGTAKTIAPTATLTLSKGESEQSFGKGTVKAAGLTCEADCDSTKVLYQGPITEPKPKAGKVVILKQAPAFGSKFIGWTGCDSVSEAGECTVEMDEAHSIVAEYEALPNKVLTVNKAYSSGYGTVSSKPKGIKCGSTCTQAVASMPEGAAVELLAKPGAETTFVEWVGGDCEGSTNPVCVVTMNADETTKAIFSKGGKAFAGGSEPTLTLTKEGSGYGTVKAAGLTCEVLCTSTSVLFQGPIAEPKPKAGKVVILKAASAPGSTKVAWTGCDSVNEETGECTVEMDEAHAVSATFDELE